MASCLIEIRLEARSIFRTTPLTIGKVGKACFSKRKHGSLKMMAPLEFKNCFAKYSTDEVAVRL